jgi:hypothetical protein
MAEGLLRIRRYKAFQFAPGSRALARSSPVPWSPQQAGGALAGAKHTMEQEDMPAADRSPSSFGNVIGLRLLFLLLLKVLVGRRLDGRNNCATGT